MKNKKKYQIWSEGFTCTSESSKAIFHGSSESDTFKNACISFFKNNVYFNTSRMTFWGSRLYDNEVSARKTFG